MRNLRGWLLPALLGPWLAYAATATLSVFVLGQHDGLLGGPVGNWVAIMCLATLAAALQSGVIVAVDRVRARRGVALPAGWRAWVSAAGAALAALGCWMVVAPRQFGDVWAWALAVVVPLVACAVAARLIVHRAA